MGLPVVSSRVGAMKEVVQNEVTGVLVPPGDVEALAEAMDRLATDRDLASQMGAAGRQAFMERFTIDRFRSGLGEIYRRTLEE